MAQTITDLIAEDFNVGMEDEVDRAASNIATKLDLGLTPRLPAVESDSNNIPADAAAALERSNRMATNVSARLQANMDLGNDSAEAMANAIITGVEADQTIALAADTAELKAQNRTLEIFEASGGHEAQVDRAKDAREFEIKLEALFDKRADILDDEHVGNSIIDGVINSFRVYNTEVELEATALAAAQNQQDIVNATVLTESAQKTNALTKQTANEGTIAANQRKIAAAGDAELYRVTLEQNRANAETLGAVLSATNQQMNTVMRGYELANSLEGRQLQRERHDLALQEFEQNTTFREIAARRSLIGERREQLQLQVEEGTVDAKVQSQLTALDRSEVALDREIIALTVDDATLDDRLAASKIAREQAETNLDAAKLELDREQDPAKEQALQAQWAAAQVAAERAEFEFNELKETSDIRLAVKEGALKAQTLSNEMQEINARAAKLLEEGRTAEALAALEDARSSRVDTETVKADNVASVQAYQSFIFGAHAVEDAAVINAQLDSGNSLYILMRQLGSARGPNGEFILGTTPAKALANLALMEQHGVVSDDITGVRILREVRSILEREHAENPVSVPVDDTARDIQFNKAATEYMQDKGSEIVFGDTTNPLHPPTIPQMLELSSTLGEQPLFKDVLVPAGSEDTNVDNIIAKALQATQAGTISQEEAVEGIVSMGNVIGLNNNVNHHGLQVIGLPYQTSVNMRVSKPRGLVTSLISGTLVSLDSASPIGFPISSTSQFTTLDISDSVAVRQHLISILSSTTIGGRSTERTIEEAE